MNLHELTVEFEKVYFTKIEPKLKSLEKERIKVRNTNCILVLIMILLFASIFYFLPKIEGETSFPLVIFIIDFILLAIVVVKICNFIKKIKSQILLEILRIFGDFYILENEIITEHDIIKTGLFPSFRSKIDDDNIAGIYQGKSISIVETELSHRVGSRKHRRTVIDFKGLIVKTVLNKTYHGRTLLYQQCMQGTFDNQVLKFFGSVSKLNNFAQRIIPRGLEKVELEDPKFNTIYEVFSDDQIEARYVITTAFMERLMNIREVIQASNVHCYIEDNYLTLFLENRSNFFEVGSVFKTLYNKERFEKIFKQLVCIFELVHYFKLDKNIGL